jgi:hypothetical protein
MKVIGKDIGTALDGLYEELASRVRIEAERELSVDAFEGTAFSNVSWRRDGVVISLHNGVPTHALPHVFGVALQHVRQRLDRYPAVRRGQQNDPAEGPLLRTALRELVLAPEADLQLERFELDTSWETEQRHAGYKELLRDADDDWNEVGNAGNAFAALQYARFAIDHPADLWTSLREQTVERLPAAAEHGEGVVQVLRRTGWLTLGACLQSLVAVRDELSLRSYALIEDRRSGEIG